MLDAPTFSPRNLSRNEPSDAGLTPDQCSKIIHMSKPNREIPHPKSKELFPIVYSLLNNCIEELPIHFIVKNKPNVIYKKYYHQKILPISLLHSAILQQKEAIVNCIFELNMFPLNQINTPYHPVGSAGLPGPSETALSLATRQYQPKVMQQLIEYGAKIYQKNPDQEDCLTKAVKYGSSAKSLSFLFEQKEIKNHQIHHSLLHNLIENQNPKMQSNERIASADILLANNNCLDALNQNKHTPLYESIKKPGLKDFSLHLLSLGADISALFQVHGDVRTPLPHAVPVIEAYASKLHLQLKATNLISDLCPIIIEFCTGIHTKK